MNTKILCAVVVLGFITVGCGQPNEATPSQPVNQILDNTNSSIERRDGALVVGFPTASIPLIDKAVIQSSLKNETGLATVYEATYFSATEVTALYAKYTSQLTNEGWLEHTPQSQEVGMIKIKTGVFTKGKSSLSVAVQTATGEEKAQGGTKVLLKIEGAQ